MYIEACWAVNSIDRTDTEHTCEYRTDRRKDGVNRIRWTETISSLRRSHALNHDIPVLNSPEHPA